MSGLRMATEAVARAGRGSSVQIIDAALRAVREHLGMPVAYLSEFVGDESVYHHVDAPGLEALIKPGDRRRLDDVYCRHILAGRLPELIPDTAREPVAVAMPITAAVPIGSHVSVPIRLRDGSVFGMFCCLSPEPNQSLNPRDLQTMRVFADIAAEQIQIEQEARREALEAEARIRNILASRQMDIVYQPIRDLGASRIAGFEALCRIPAEPRRPPDQWFAEAWTTPLGASFELVAIVKALEGLLCLDPTQYISINASPATLLDPRFGEIAMRVPPERLLIEVTEHAAVDDYARLQATLAPLRARGIRLAIDDAGAGHSSLRHIVQLAPDFIKLDMSLTRDVDTDIARRALVSALVFYTRETEAQIIAEGIETEAELATLRTLGVRRGQGYLLGRPEKLATYVKASAAPAIDAA